MTGLVLEPPEVYLHPIYWSRESGLIGTGVLFFSFQVFDGCQWEACVLNQTGHDKVFSTPGNIWKHVHATFRSHCAHENCLCQKMSESSLLFSLDPVFKYLPVLCLLCVSFVFSLRLFIRDRIHHLLLSGTDSSSNTETTTVAVKPVVFSESRPLPTNLSSSDSSTCISDPTPIELPTVL